MTPATTTKTSAPAHTREAGRRAGRPACARVPARDDMRIIALLAHGLTGTQIGVRLGMPGESVNAHLERIAAQVGVGGPAGIIGHCYKLGMLRRTAGDRAAPDVPLAAGEDSVLAMIGQGRVDREIAADIGLTERTVRAVVARLALKLGARTRAHLVHLGYQLGHLPLADRPPSALRAALALPGAGELRAEELTGDADWAGARGLRIPPNAETVLRRDLRTLRVAAGLSAGAVADALNASAAADALRWTSTRVGNLELGLSAVSVPVLRALLTLYRLTVPPPLVSPAPRMPDVRAVLGIAGDGDLHVAELTGEVNWAAAAAAGLRIAVHEEPELRRGLRAARLAAGLGVGAAAAKLGFSQSKLSLIEAGQASFLISDVQAMLDLYGVRGTP